MATYLNRQALLDGARRAATYIQSQARAEHDKRVTEHRERQDRWVEANGQAWLDALPVIRKTIKAGKPVTDDMLPKDTSDGRYSASPSFRYNAPGEFREQPMPVNLAKLIAALDALDGDTVSPSMLTNLGVSRTAISDALSFVARETQAREDRKLKAVK